MLQEADNERFLAERRAVHRGRTDEQNTNRRHAAEFITQLPESGVLEKWQIDDQARAAPALLKRSADRVIRPADNPPQANANALPGPDLTKTTIAQMAHSSNDVGPLRQPSK